jgi:5-methylcytosine-specific restriction enzyme A
MGLTMTPETFRAIRKDRLRLTQQDVAEITGLSVSTIQMYEAGRRRGDGRPAEIPKIVRLAYWALCHGVTDWDGTVGEMPSRSSLKRRLLREQGGVCAWCGQPLDAGTAERFPTLDHVIPRSRGGSNDADNIVVACLACNAGRGQSLPDRLPPMLITRLSREAATALRFWHDPREDEEWEDEEWEDT